MLFASPSLALALTIALGGSSPPPAVAQPAPPTSIVFPHEDDGACPQLGCRYGPWIASRMVTVRRSRHAGARPVFRVAAGETVEALTGVVVTLRPGRGRAEAAIELPDVRIGAGEPLLLLRPAGAGGYVIAAHGRVVRIPAELARARLAVLSEPRSVWWVQLRNAGGELGWSSEPEAFGGT